MESRISEIYKLVQLNSIGEIKQVIVFSGEGAQQPTIDDLFSENQLPDKNIPIVFSKQLIHKDDSIRIIKKKIIKEFSREPISYDEIYLFCKKHVNNYSTLNAYKQITNDEKNILTRDMLSQYLINIDITDINQNITDSAKESYTFEDISFIPKEL